MEKQDKVNLRGTCVEEAEKFLERTKFINYVLVLFCFGLLLSNRAIYLNFGILFFVIAVFVVASGFYFFYSYKKHTRYILGLVNVFFVNLLIFLEPANLVDLFIYLAILVFSALYFDERFSGLLTGLIVDINIIEYFFAREHFFPGVTIDQITIIGSILLFTGIVLLNMVHFTNEWQNRFLILNKALEHEVTSKTKELQKALESQKLTQNQLIERERLASLGSLTAGLAHDIKSPLFSLQCYLKEIENLANEYKESIGNPMVTEDDHRAIADEILDICQKTDRASRRITSIIDSIKNHTRNVSGVTEITFNVADLLKDIELLLAHELKKSGCSLSYEKDKKIEIVGDPGKLSQVLTNLIINAIHAYEGNPGTITIEVDKKGNEVEIKVIDKGAGIKPEIRDRIFKEILTTKGAQGTGLGLYISYSIITAHFGGKMEFQSEVGKGTTFTITIPVERKKEND